MRTNAALPPHLNTLLFFLLITFFSWQNAYAQPNLVYQPVITTGLSSPIDIVNAGDGSNRLFVVQQGGTIRVYDQAFAYLGNLVTVAGISTGGEMGLLSAAFHPDYETNRFFYVYYTTMDGSNTSYINVARYQTRAANPNIADDTSRRVLLTIAKPTGTDFTNHNGGRLQFGQDGHLYFATGDGGSGGDPFNNAQNGNSLLGKMIRLNVNVGPANAYVAPYYTIPSDNPYVSDPNVRDEIFSMGLRNPFRWSFDRLTGDMWIGDVGQGAREEINFRAAGPPSPANYGWRCYEGNLPYNTSGCAAPSSYTFPVFDYPNPNPGSAAVTGGQVYRGTEFPTMYGVYIASDFYSGTHYKIRPNGSGGWSVTSQPGPTFIAAFGEGEDGSLYAVSLGGSVSEVTTNTALPVRLINLNAIRRTDHIEISWKTTNEVDLSGFEVEYSLDGSNFQPAGTITASNNLNGGAYSFEHFLTSAGLVYYRLKIKNINGSVEYSPIVTTSWDRQLNGAFTPGIIRNQRLLITIYQPFTSLRLISSAGTTVFLKNISGMTGFNTISLPQLPAGGYVLQLTGNGRHFSERIVIAR
ncbi:MAG TPA: PQQ-dependent sugar dehydrogenase [Chitinophagaceae bacterium]